MAQHLHDGSELVRCAERLRFDDIVKGSHCSTPMRAPAAGSVFRYHAAIASRLRIISRLVRVPLHKPLGIARQLAAL